jgi:4-hydroxy-tetrahydrodipicolinate synthase
MSTNFEGTGVALITPFNDDLSIDYSSLEKVINHAISGGVEFLVTLGTTGEPATLTHQEKKDIIAFCKEKIKGRVPLVVGAGGNNTAQVIEEINELDINGIAGLLSVAPYYNKPTQKGLFEHFKAIAGATTLPIIIYNVPGRTGSNISAITALQVAEKCKNIVAVKEASGDFSQIMQVLKNKPDSFNMLSGDDALTLPMISLGTQGVISVVANSHPREFSELVRAALKNDYDTANAYQFKLIDYIDALFTEGSPAGVKAAMEIMGLCKKHVRLPLVSVPDEHYVKLQELLSEI